MHYYSFHIGDYRKDTAHLIPIEHYINRSLIDMYYLDEKPISSITHSVIRRLGLVIENTINVENVLADFFVLHDDGYHHKRIDQELDEYHGKCVINKANGIKGGRPRKTQSVTDGNPMLTENNPELTLTSNQEPLTINQKQTIKTSATFVLPDWVNRSHWDLWVSSRKKMNSDQKQMQVEKLKKWKDDGLDFAGALLNAAANGTQGLFLPNENKVNGNRMIKSDNFESKDYGTGVSLL